MTTLSPRDFSHLHVHSEYSLLDGLGRITDLVDSAAQQGFESLALTDHGALYGAVAFYQAATSKGIKPIIGVETYVARRSMGDREGKADAQPFHLILLASDDVGYRNLCRLVTDAHVERLSEVAFSVPVTVSASATGASFAPVSVTTIVFCDVAPFSSVTV